MPPRKATKRKKPLKILIYGPSGVGKTHFALHATPGKTLCFDFEGGTDLFEGRVDFDYWTDDEGFKTQSYRELRKCIDYLKTPEGRNNYETFILDPLTLLWTLLQQERQDYKEAAALKKRRGVAKDNETDLESFTTRDWNIVKKMHKTVVDEVCGLPQNVVLIAREKPVVIMKNGEPVQTGEITFEGEKNTIYAVDFSFRIWVDLKKQKRYCQISKDRSGHYATGDVIEDPTFALFNEIVNGMEGGEETKGIKTDTGNTFIDEENQKNSPGWHLYAAGKAKGLSNNQCKVLIWLTTKTTDSTKNLPETEIKRVMNGIAANTPEQLKTIIADTQEEYAQWKQGTTEQKAAAQG